MSLLVARRTGWAVMGPLLLLLTRVAAAPSVGVAAEPEKEAPSTLVSLDAELAPRRVSSRWLPAGTSVQAPFRLTVGGAVMPTRLHAFTVLPGEALEVRAGSTRDAVLRYGAGSATPVGDAAWRWTAPARPGIYALRVVTASDSVDLTALVLHPATAVRNGVLNGYRIGRYQTRPLNGRAAYRPPRGFVEVAASDRDILVTPHFTLGQFLCKQPGEPRYLALSTTLLDKLEIIAGTLAERGHPASSLIVMSGFRTPAYNAAIGNITVYSRHLWGDAADIYVDADHDGDMDDLNGDGRVDVRDARVLVGWIDDAARRAPVRDGGLAAYRRTSAHGPFVHVDTRGFKARW